VGCSAACWRRSELFRQTHRGDWGGGPQPPVAAVTGLDQPRDARTWSRHNPAMASFLAQARRWITTVIEAPLKPMVLRL